MNENTEMNKGTQSLPIRGDYSLEKETLTGRYSVREVGCGKLGF